MGTLLARRRRARPNRDLNFVARRAIVVCFEPTGYGGVATATYNLFAWLQARRLACRLVVIYGREHEGFYRHQLGEDFINPRKIDNVQGLALDMFDQPDLDCLSDAVDECGADLIIAVGVVAADLCARAGCRPPMLYYTAGLHQPLYLKTLRWDARRFARYLLWLGQEPYLVSPIERRAVAASSVVATHSPMVRWFLKRCHQQFSRRILQETFWMADWIVDDPELRNVRAKPFAERDIDVLFIASDWNRTEKNVGLLSALARRLTHVRICLVGEGAPTADNAIIVGFEGSRERVFELYARAKVVCCPSRFDAAPGVLFEAAALGCNLVATRNCGNWRICPSGNAPARATAKFLKPVIESALANPQPNSLDMILRTKSFERFAELVESVRP